MYWNHADGKAGGFAERRFRQRRRAWRRRIWWAFPLVGVFVFVVAVGLGALLQPEHLEFYVGAGIGGSLSLIVALYESPPHHIERWRQGADGERATWKALRPLRKAGWVIVNDLDRGFGNVDHVVIGPPGIFLLDSKNLHGLVSVEAGVLTVKWREDPQDGYENRRLAARSRAAAAELSQALSRTGEPRVWVQPVVVLWSAFEQRSVEAGGVAWVRGNALADVLAARPSRLSDEQVEWLAPRLRGLTASPAAPRRSASTAPRKRAETASARLP